MKRLILALALVLALAGPALAEWKSSKPTLDENESKDFEAIDFGGDQGYLRSAVAYCSGTWDTATITFYVSVDGINFVNAQDAAGNLTCTADCAVQFIGGSSDTFGPFQNYRLTMSSAGASSDVTCTVMEGWE